MPRHPSKLITAIALFCLPILASQPASASQRKVSVRVTTGTVVTRGWEHNLVKGNPNLAHWHWDPIYSNVTGRMVRGPESGRNLRNRVPPSQFIPAAPPRSHYTKPKHIPIILTKRPAPKPPVLANRDVNARLSQNRVSANLSQNKVSAMLAQNQVSGTLANRQAQGMLIDKNARARLFNQDTPKIAAQPEQAPVPPVIATYGQKPTSSLDDFGALAGYSSQRTASRVSAVIASGQAPSKAQSKAAPKLRHKQRRSKQSSAGHRHLSQPNISF